VLAIETPRLRLHLPAESHAAPLAEIHQDPEVAQFVLGTPAAPVSIDAAWRNVAMLLGHWQLRGFGSWVIEERATGAIAGRVGFWQPPSWSAIELTWLIGRAHWGQGLATEAAGSAVAWSRAHISTDRIISLIQPANTRSIRVATKLGYRLNASCNLAGIVHHEYELRMRQA
jgi:RimJ/RimL family protein N-acetyltransferase